jgi:adenine-specific DNA-methyltransferase
LWYTKGKKYLFNDGATESHQNHEASASSTSIKIKSPLAKNPGDVWSFPNVKGNHIEETCHTCQYPIELPARLIWALSRPGDLVVDPFMGVGTTAVAAVLLERKAAGADLNKEYLNIARKRVRQAARGTVPVHSLGLNISGVQCIKTEN